MAKRGRPFKYPGRDPAHERDELVALAAKLFEVPYDDRKLRDPDAPSLNEVARSLSITVLKARKLLITAKVYTTELSRAVQCMSAEGNGCEKIMETLGLGRASVNSYLPYGKGVYLLTEPSLYSEQSTRYRHRRDILQMIAALQEQPEFALVWEAMLAFESYPFKTIGRNGQDGIRFTYSVPRISSGDFDQKLIINTKRKTVTKATVELGYKNAVAVLEREGCVAGPLKLGIPGAESYLYPVFLKLGLFKCQ